MVRKSWRPFVNQKHVTSGLVARLLSQADGYDYLRNGYEVLHMIGREWLMGDMDELFAKRGLAI